MEVMISMAVMGLVLGFSYSSANHSLSMAQDSKERSTALRIAESQVELVKAYISNEGAAGALAASHYCMVYSSPPPNFSTETIPDANDFSSYPNACKHDNDRYHVAITPDGDDYRITARWESLFGGNSEVLVMYKFASTSPSGGGGGGGGGPPADTEAPSRPTNLSGVYDEMNAEIYLSWSASTDIVGVVGYYIYRDGSQVGSSLSTNYYDLVAHSSTHGYQVAAYDAAGNISLRSDMIMCTPGGGGEGTPCF